MSNETLTYVEAYSKLSAISAEIRQSSDLDLVAKKVEEGMEVYKVCKDRIEAVRKLINQIPIPE